MKSWLSVAVLAAVAAIGFVVSANAADARRTQHVVNCDVLRKHFEFAAVMAALETKVALQ